MRRPKRYVPFFICILALAILTAFAGTAATAPLSVQGGKVVLSLSGLEIELPALPGDLSYRVSGSWMLNDNQTFDSRDVVDEFRGGALVAGNWVLTGYFTAGDCSAAVDDAKLDSAWKSDLDLWDTRWKVRGGVFTFSGELGRKPAAVLCSQLGQGKAIMLYRFFLEQPESMTRAAMIEAVPKSAVLEAAWHAYRTERTAPVAPTKREEVRNRGTVPPTRNEKLLHSGLELQLPDDGFVWLVKYDSSAATDFIDRMAPALPEVSLEVGRFEQPNCAAAFATIGAEKRSVAPQNLPPGWEPGPQLVVGSELELTACHYAARGVVLVGVFQGPQRTDMAYLTPLLEAIARAAAQPGKK
ncbi:MAG: hypothetical protein AB1427_20260 [Thermodesulfobacteriota bacterium]